MSSFKIKLNLIFFPLLLLAISVILIYSFLYWLFFIQLQVLSLKEDVLHIWLTAAVSFSAILLFIRRRVHLLKLDADNGRIRPLYYFIGAAVMWIPLIFLLPYLDTITGKLITLNNIQEIADHKSVKFYSIDSFALHKTKTGTKSVISYSGKNNRYLDLKMYFAVPFTPNRDDSISTPPAFLAIKYHKQVSGNIPDNERRIEWEIFSERTFREFDDESFDFIYLERMANTDDRDNFIIAAKESPLYKTAQSVLILKPINESFESRNGNKFTNTLLSFVIGIIVWFIVIMIPSLHIDKANHFRDTDSNVTNQLKSAAEFLTPRKDFAATPILIILNMLVFVVMVFAGLGFIDFSTHNLLTVGASYKPYVQKGEWWRLITAMFLHGGIIHLFMNMASLYLGGLFSEGSLGTKKFLLVYAVSGIGAGLISMEWHSTPVVAVGASGAIFGLFGLLLAFALFNKFSPDMKGFVLVLLACTAGYSLLIGLVSRGIDNSAHFGGLIIGFLLGCFLRSNIQYNPPKLNYSIKKRKK